MNGIHFLNLLKFLENWMIVRLKFWLCHFNSKERDEYNKVQEWVEDSMKSMNKMRKMKGMNEWIRDEYWEDEAVCVAGLSGLSA